MKLEGAGNPGKRRGHILDVEPRGIARVAIADALVEKDPGVVAETVARGEHVGRDAWCARLVAVLAPGATEVGASSVDVVSETSWATAGRSATLDLDDPLVDVLPATLPEVEDRPGPVGAANRFAAARLLEQRNDRAVLSARLAVRIVLRVDHGAEEHLGQLEVDRGALGRRLADFEASTEPH